MVGDDIAILDEYYESDLGEAVMIIGLVAVETKDI